MMKIMIDGENQRLYQWDTGQRLVLEGIPSGTHVDFEHIGHEPLGRETYEENGKIYVDIPNEILRSGRDITAWFYIREGDRGETIYGWYGPVRERSKPTDYVYTEEEQKYWEILSGEIEELKKGGGGGGSIIVDEDGFLTTASGGFEIDGDGYIVM